MGILELALGACSLVVGVVAMIAVSAAGRWAAVRLLGVRGVPFPFGASARWSWTTSSVVPQALGIAGSIVATYAMAGVLYAGGACITGVDIEDSTSMRVRVNRGGRADQGGIRSGDRVDAIDGERVTSWDALRNAVRKHPSEPIDVTLWRDGGALHATVTPDDTGRIGVVAPVEHESVGVGRFAAITALAPAGILYSTAQSWLRMVSGTERLDVAGPIAIVRQAEGDAHGSHGWGGWHGWRGWNLLLALGLVGTYTLPIFAITAVFTGPGRRRSQAPRGAHRGRGAGSHGGGATEH
jgi:membrane-associated protease RseP (regulator of RpoE activity)